MFLQKVLSLLINHFNKLKNVAYEYKKNSTETRFELAQVKPNNLAGCRLNHSATTSITVLGYLDNICIQLSEL